MLEWDLGLCTFSEYDDAFLGIAVDPPGELNAGADPGIPLSHYGFEARPLPPVRDSQGSYLTDQACTALYGYYGSELRVLPLRDPRISPLYSALQEGESRQYGPRGNYVLCGAFGNLDLTAPGDAIVTSPNITLQHPSAGVSLSVTSGGHQLFHPSGNQVNVSASGVTLGQLAGALPVVVAPFLEAYLALVEAWAVSLIAAVASKTSAVTPPLEVPPFPLPVPLGTTFTTAS